MAEEYQPGNVPKILNLIGIIFCTLFTFMGLVYALHGNYWLSSFIALVVLVLLYLLPERLAIFKIKKRKQPDAMPEFILGGLYLLVVLFTFPFIFHFLDVDFGRKNELKKEGLGKLSSIRDLRTSYETALQSELNTFRTSVETYMRNFMAATGSEKNTYAANLEAVFPGAIDFRASNETIATRINYLIDQKMKIKKRALTLEDLYPEYDAYDERVTPVFENWKFLKVSYYFTDADSMFNKLYSATRTKMPSFSYEKADDSRINIDSPSQSLKNASILKILGILVIVVLLHLCILAPYLSASRYQNALARNTSAYEKPEGSIKL